MASFEHAVPLLVNLSALLFGIATPEDENNVVRAFVDVLDDCTGPGLPALHSTQLK